MKQKSGPIESFKLFIIVKAIFKKRDEKCGSLIYQNCTFDSNPILIFL